VTARAQQEGREAREAAVTLGAKLAAKEIQIGKLYERLQAAEARTSRAEASAPRLQP